MTPIRDVIERIVARVVEKRDLFPRKNGGNAWPDRRSVTFSEEDAEITAPVPIDPEEERVADAFAEPEIGW